MFYLWHCCVEGQPWCGIQDISMTLPNNDQLVDSKIEWFIRQQHANVGSNTSLAPRRLQAKSLWWHGLLTQVCVTQSWRIELSIEISLKNIPSTLIQNVQSFLYSNIFFLGDCIHSYVVICSICNVRVVRLTRIPFTVKDYSPHLNQCIIHEHRCRSKGYYNCFFYTCQWSRLTKVVNSTNA